MADTWFDFFWYNLRLARSPHRRIQVSWNMQAESHKGANKKDQIYGLICGFLLGGQTMISGASSTVTVWIPITRSLAWLLVAGTDSFRACQSNLFLLASCWINTVFCRVITFFLADTRYRELDWFAHIDYMTSACLFRHSVWCTLSWVAHMQMATWWCMYATYCAFHGTSWNQQFFRMVLCSNSHREP